MLDLKEENLAKLPRDGKIRKFMSEIKRVNENPTFMHYMTKEEDDEKCRMTEPKEANEVNRVKIMLKKKMSLNDIVSITDLSLEEALENKYLTFIIF